MSARKIIIDTDPGQDDAVAILLALASPEDIDVLGITAVAGNVPLPLTQKNARTICELANKAHVGVYAGCDRPLGRDLVTAEHVHGKTGLNGPDLADPTMPLQDTHAVDYIIDTLERQLFDEWSLAKEHKNREEIFSELLGMKRFFRRLRAIADNAQLDNYKSRKDG